MFEEFEAAIHLSRWMGKKPGTRAAKSDAEVFPTVEVSIGSMPALAQQTWILIASFPEGHVDILGGRPEFPCDANHVKRTRIMRALACR